MAKLRLLTDGMKAYTGWMGPIQFEDGLSVRDVTQLEAQRIGAITLAELVEDDGSAKQAGIAASIVQNRASTAPEETAAPVEEPAKTMTDDEEVEDAPFADMQSPADAPFRIYTREELEAVADEKGIKGLRAIGEPLEARHTSIRGLIDEIMAVQARMLGK